jgi:hypothetical protein
MCEAGFAVAQPAAWQAGQPMAPDGLWAKSAGSQLVVRWQESQENNAGR